MLLAPAVQRTGRCAALAGCTGAVRAARVAIILVTVGLPAEVMIWFETEESRARCC